MELTSQEAEIPMPLNSAYGGGGGGGGGVRGHGHMTHQHHYHHNHHHHKQQDPPFPSSSSTPPSHTHTTTTTTIVPPPPPSSTHNISNGATTIPPSSTNGGTPVAATTEGGQMLQQQQQQVPPSHEIRDCNPNSNFAAGAGANAATPSLAPAATTKAKVGIRYRECQKNHAAAMGGNATDGCGEFMPSGEEGTLEALTCSACNCHRNFHRKEIEGGLLHEHDHDQHPHHHHQYYPTLNYHPTPHPHPQQHHLVRGRKGFLGYPTGGPPPGGVNVNVIPVSRAVPINNLPPYHVGPVPSDDQSDDHDHHDHHHPQKLVKKRFRTKFNQQQKEKMLEFAEKVGWKIQKQEESVVQQFCQEVGVKRRVLKVWMHNNKHTFAKKINNNNNINIVNPPNLTN